MCRPCVFWLDPMMSSLIDTGVHVDGIHHGVPVCRSICLLPVTSLSSMHPSADQYIIVWQKLMYSYGMTPLPFRHTHCGWFFSSKQLPEYLSHVDKRLSQENDRLFHYLHKTTRFVRECTIVHSCLVLSLKTDSSFNFTLVSLLTQKTSHSLCWETAGGRAPGGNTQER